MYLCVIFLFFLGDGANSNSDDSESVTASDKLSTSITQESSDTENDEDSSRQVSGWRGIIVALKS